MKIRVNKEFFVVAALLLILFFILPAFSQDTEKAAPPETITKYREILKTAKSPEAIAQAHYEIGFALEKLDRKTEATAEYLKIIVNYPELTEINKKAEKRLAGLYSGFSEKSEELADRYKETDKEKSPTMFFAYIKSLYENYRNLGQYDRAINILKKVYDLDPQNQAYLIDMGEIYLDGYNDAEKAIFHFKKALEVNPNNLRVYAGLGRAYEKKGDYEKAVSSYARATELSPANPWAIYGLRRMDGIRLARERRLVKDWYFLGPLDNTDNVGLKKRFPPEEKIDLTAAYTGKEGAAIKWKRPFGYEASGYVDLNMLFKPGDFVVAYALTYVHSPNDRKIQIRFGAEDGIKVWLNDEEIASYEATVSAEVDSDLIGADVKKGWNKILLKVSDTWGSWGFYFRVTDLNGNPAEDLIFDPLKDDTRLKRVYGKIVREKRFRMTKIAALYTVAVAGFLFGLYFMVSNIRNKIKINRMKEDFISNVSHELKTPIAAVKMLTETLKRGKVKADSKKDQYYDMIIRESDRLTRFIGKILDFSKIEKGKKVFYFEKENIADLAKSAIDIYRDEVQDEALKIRFTAGEDRILAEVDKDAIFQVIFNLIDNAYKYSKDKKDITVNVGKAGDNVRVEVIDKGVGIPRPNIERVFEKFYRVERDMRRGIKGSGLGLSFVKSVVDAHGGRIGVESEVGKGTKFAILLPVERA